MSTAAMSDPVAEVLVREFEELFREHADLVFGSAFSTLGKREDAEDVVQTVFLRLLRRGLPAEFQKNPKAYLYRASINESLNIIRTRRRHPTTDLEQAGVSEVPAQTSSDEAIHRKLFEAIAELQPGSAELVMLRYVHNRSDADIAKFLGKSRVTIAVRLHRARVHLKKVLRSYFREEL